MTKIVRQFFPIMAALSVMSACQSVPTYQDSYFGPQNTEQTVAAGFEKAQYLPAKNFFSPQWMKSPLHTIDARAYNDGYANTYKITTPNNVYVVQGTEQAKERIFEIQATETLRNTPTIVAAAKAFKDRTQNLVQTPYRAIKGGAARYANAKTSKYGVPEDSLGTISSGLGSVMTKLGNGLKELGTTGVRITTSAAGTKCSGIECARKAGEDIWSGVNSLTGKHAAARRMHQRLGTDPYSVNRVLQNEISRLAYAESYAGTSYKFGVAGAGLSIISPLAKGVGYYNNTEFAAQYEDAHKRRNKEKALLKNWGTRRNAVDTLYKNKAFTHTTRTRLMQALEKIDNRVFKASAIENAALSETRYVANSKLAIYQYLAKLEQKGELSGYVENAPTALAVRKNGAMLMPLSADYLQWTNEIKPLIKGFAFLVSPERASSASEIHVIGRVSPLFAKNAKKLGLKVKEVSP